MNPLRISFPVLLLFLVASIASAQTSYRMGVFISGYKLNPDETQTIWGARGTPQAWQNSGVLNHVINLDAEVASLLNARSSDHLMQLVNNADVRTRVVSQLTAKIAQRLIQVQANGPVNVDLVIVGHGVIGGYLARFIAGSASSLGLSSFPYRTGQSATLRVIPITVSTPHQGLPLAEAALYNESGYRNVNPIITDYTQTIKYGLTERTSWITRFGINSVTMLADALNTIDFCDFNFINNWRLKLHETRSGLRQGNQAVQAQVIPAMNDFMNNIYPDIIARDAQATLVGAKSLIAPGGTIINSLNSLPSPTYYRSITGQERQHTVVRTFSEAIGGDKSGYDVNKETAVADQVNQLALYADGQAEAWEHTMCTIFAASGCRERRAQSVARWRGAATAMRATDTYWARILGAIRYEQRTDTRLEYDPSCGGGPLDPASEFDLEALFFARENTCTGDGPWREVTYVYTAAIPQQNDGLFAAEKGTWSPNGNANDRINNFLYGTSDERGYVGGYNHLELTRYSRLRTNGTSGQAPPMDDARDWLQREILR